MPRYALHISSSSSFFFFSRPDHSRVLCGVQAALKFFAEARSATAAGVLTPSQIRYAHYANEIYR
jgi:hypothetical protein